MKLVRMLLENGHLTSRGSDALGVVGVLMIWGAAYYFQDWSGFWFWAVMLSGGLLGYVGAYAGLARVFGFSAPFSSDPLGWRAAKKSYGEASDQESPKD